MHTGKPTKRLWPKFKHNRIWVVGDGKDIRFWYDKRWDKNIDLIDMIEIIPELGSKQFFLHKRIKVQMYSSGQGREVAFIVYTVAGAYSKIGGITETGVTRKWKQVWKIGN
ncbi:hypothetical protein A2U01_0013076 [Trifolium medium]|uniref:Uncharacterized protein n=1 Tax=Trifolium medium TaxID=97028 RepID=A0A392MXV4_9FABA|nr:hypothetical protein [Trifolium medium]